ncbi:MAG: hypothetical protein KDC98_11800 [Planctomycetes bacterium]|nr:hypothetical protein [Planctomycetota bacterium]
MLAAIVLVSAPQEPKPEVRISPVQFDENHWPVVPNEPVRPSLVPNGEVGRESRPLVDDLEPTAVPDQRAPAPLAEANGSRADHAPVASGMELGSPLLEVFQFTRSPSAWKALGGQAIWWRITIHGSQGEVLGIRELTHVADCTFTERDRLEYDGEGRVYGRVGGSNYAERQRMPWPSDAERGGHELMLFGTQLRMPWCFGDGITYSVLSSGTVDRPGARLRRVLLERRPLQGTSLIGPELDPRPRDRFELIYEPGTGCPREFVHRFAESEGARRVLLEDWREYQGVRIAYKRVYVDETLRRTTTLEILNIVPQQVTERTFRLH